MSHTTRASRGRTPSKKRCEGPKASGARGSYKIKRRDRPAGDWVIVSMAIETEATLNNEEGSKDWEYRVIAVNKAGKAMPSNTVAAVV